MLLGRDRRFLMPDEAGQQRILRRIGRRGGQRRGQPFHLRIHVEQRIERLHRGAAARLVERELEAEHRELARPRELQSGAQRLHAPGAGRIARFVA
ncbi:MAG: hypothetical protein J0I73_16075 [Sphingomonas sp.]|uniref:hypothetical protein n=1 Tax=Sphingomonas sp. TaxID=28214 RepID=UPI001ACBF7A7|nr:hypothetical protein [Sphingomonas sp.]MBN8849593.1 hypothetical protein [Sphingomonas sp.]